jgi:hypothetical protein
VRKSGRSSTRFVRSIEGWGVSFVLEASSNEALAFALRSLPRGFRLSSRAGRGTVLTVREAARNLELSEDGQVLFVSAKRTEIRFAIESAVEKIASTQSDRFVFLHAGVVEIDGRAIVVPGRSLSGKSTLVKALLDAGATYLSDDLAPIDASLEVHPFPRWLGLRRSAGEPQARRSWRQAGAREPKGAVPIGFLWCGVFDPSAAATSFERVRGRMAFATLLAQSPGVQIRPDIVVPRLTRLAADARIFAGARGEARQAAAEILARAREVAVEPPRTRRARTEN